MKSEALRETIKLWKNPFSLACFQNRIGARMGVSLPRRGANPLLWHFRLSHSVGYYGRNVQVTIPLPPENKLLDMCYQGLVCPKKENLIYVHNQVDHHHTRQMNFSHNKYPYTELLHPLSLKYHVCNMLWSIGLGISILLHIFTLVCCMHTCLTSFSENSFSQYPW
jgi:hypothetical protein